MDLSDFATSSDISSVVCQSTSKATDGSDVDIVTKSSPLNTLNITGANKRKKTSGPTSSSKGEKRKKPAEVVNLNDSSPIILNRNAEEEAFPSPPLSTTNADKGKYIDTDPLNLSDINLDMFLTPPNPIKSVRIKHFPVQISASPEDIPSQVEYLQQSVPADVTNFYGNLDPVAAGNAFIQSSLTHHFSVVDQVMRYRNHAADLANAQQQVRVEKERVATLEKHAAERAEVLRSAQNEIELRSKKEADLQAENDRLKEELERFKKENVDLKDAQKIAAENFFKLQQHLPDFFLKIVRSSAVKTPFGNLILASKDNDRALFCKRMCDECKIEVLPESISKLVKPDAEQRLAAANAAANNLDLTYLKEFCARKDLSLDDIINAEF